MNVNRSRTALVTGAAVAALMLATSAWAAPQRPVVVEVQEPPAIALQEARAVQERTRGELRRAYELAQVMPSGTVRFRINGEGRLADRVLAGAEELELSETQTDTVRNLKRTYRRDEIRRDADIEIAELELDEMMEVDNVDLDAIEAHMRHIAGLQVDERIARMRLDRAVKDILTAEQIDELEEMTPQNMVFGTYMRRNR